MHVDREARGGENKNTGDQRRRGAARRVASRELLRAERSQAERKRESARRRAENETPARREQSVGIGRPMGSH